MLVRISVRVSGGSDAGVTCPAIRVAILFIASALLLIVCLMRSHLMVMSWIIFVCDPSILILLISCVMEDTVLYSEVHASLMCLKLSMLILLVIGISLNWFCMSSICRSVATPIAA